MDPTNFAEVGIPLRNPPRRLEDSDGFAKRGEKWENVGTKGGAKMWNPCFEWIVCEKGSSWTWAIYEVLQILSLHVWSFFIPLFAGFIYPKNSYKLEVTLW